MCPGHYVIKDKNTSILKSDLGTLIQYYNIGLLFQSQTYESSYLLYKIELWVYSIHLGLYMDIGEANIKIMHAKRANSSRSGASSPTGWGQVHPD